MQGYTKLENKIGKVSMWPILIPTILKRGRWVGCSEWHILSYWVEPAFDTLDSSFLTAQTAARYGSEKLEKTTKSLGKDKNKPQSKYILPSTSSLKSKYSIMPIT